MRNPPRSLLPLMFFLLPPSLIGLLLIKNSSWSLETSKSYAFLIIFITFLLFLLLYKFCIPKTITMMWGLFLIVGLLLLPFSSSIAPGIRELTLIVSYLCIFLVSYNAGLLFKNSRYPVYLLMLLGLVILCFGLWLHFNALKGGLTMSNFHLTLPFGWDNLAAGFYLLLFPLPLAAALASKNIKEKIIFGVISLVFLLAIFFTYSRGGWLSLVVIPVVFLTFYYSRNLVNIKYRKRLVFASVLLIAIVVFVLKSKVLALINISVGWRLSIYAAAWKMFINNWLTGVGLDNFGRAYPFYQVAPWVFSRFAHNQFIQFACETGIFGSVLFFSLPFYVLWKTVLVIKRRTDTIDDKTWITVGLLAAFLASLVHSLIDIDWNYPYIALLFWIEGGLLISLLPEPDVKRETLSNKIKIPVTVISLLLVFWSIFLLKINNDYLKAQQVLREGKILEGKKILVDINGRYPLDSYVLRWLGAISRQEGQLTKAKEEYVQAAKLDSYSTEPTFNLALIALQEKDLGSAESYLRQAIKANPYLTPTYYRVLAEILISQGKLKEAKEVLGTALGDSFPFNDYYQSYQYMYNYPDISLEMTRITNLQVNLLRLEGKSDEGTKLLESLEKAKKLQKELKNEGI